MGRNLALGPPGPDGYSPHSVEVSYQVKCNSATSNQRKAQWTREAGTAPALRTGAVCDSRRSNRGMDKPPILPGMAIRMMSVVLSGREVAPPKPKIVLSTPDAVETDDTSANRDAIGNDSDVQPVTPHMVRLANMSVGFTDSALLRLAAHMPDTERSPGAIRGAVVASNSELFSEPETIP